MALKKQWYLVEKNGNVILLFSSNIVYILQNLYLFSIGKILLLNIKNYIIYIYQFFYKIFIIIFYFFKDFF